VVVVVVVVAVVVVVVVVVVILWWRWREMVKQEDADKRALAMYNISTWVAGVVLMKTSASTVSGCSCSHEDISQRERLDWSSW
jgi:hypothetical protein